MPVTLGLLLSKHNARVRRPPDPRIGVVLLERTLLDPPRAAATKRWGAQLRRSFPRAQFVPYAWHLVSHGPQEPLRTNTSRSLPGDPHLFGGLQTNPQTDQAWEVSRLCVQALETNTVAVRTPPSITPGALGRSRIRAFVAARQAEGLAVLWEPQGLWEPAVALQAAKEAGATLLLPGFVGGRPARDEGAEGLTPPAAWVRVDGSGPKQGIHGGHVDELLDHVDLFPNSTVVFAGRRARNNLSQFAEALD